MFHPRRPPHQAPPPRRHTGYYEELGVAVTATDKEIKAAYHRLARDHHPDKGGDVERFKRICVAHECLSDAEKRRIYDTHGPEGVSNHEQATAHGQQMPPHGGMSPFGPGLNDILHAMGGMMGGMMGGAEFVMRGPDGRTYVVHQSGNLPRKVPPVQQMIHATLEQLYAAQTFQFPVTLHERNGETGELEVRTKTMQITLGLAHELGNEVVLENRGNHSADPSVQPGDIVVVPKAVQHPLYEPIRAGSFDLLHRRKLTLAEAIGGFDFTLPYLDAQRTPLRIVSEPGVCTTAGTVLAVPGCGWPVRTSQQLNDPTERARIQREAAQPFNPHDAAQTAPDRRGTLYILLDVDFPAQVSVDLARALSVAVANAARRVRSPPPVNGALLPLPVLWKRAPHEIEERIAHQVLFQNKAAQLRQARAVHEAAQAPSQAAAAAAQASVTPPS